MQISIRWRCVQKRSSIRNCGRARAKRDDATSGERTRLACWFRRSAETVFPLIFASSEHNRGKRKFATARTRSPAREPRALPRVSENARDYSPSRWRNCALAYSRLSFAMKLALILAGHTASHSYVLVQLPNPCSSITCTIFNARRSRSGTPCGKDDKCETFAAAKSIADPFGHAAAHAPLLPLPGQRCA